MTGKSKSHSNIFRDEPDNMGDLIRRTYHVWDKMEWKQEKRRVKHNNKDKTIKHKKHKKIKKPKKPKRYKPKTQKTETYKKIKEGRSEGDSPIYYAIHNLIGSGFFIFIIFYYDLFNLREITVGDVLTVNFLYSILVLFIISVTTNILGRFLGHPILTLIYRKTVTKTFWELNSTGINKIGLRYFGAIFISSLLFALGAVAIIQNKVFKENTLESLILTYLIIKIIIYTITKIWIKTKG